MTPEALMQESAKLRREAKDIMMDREEGQDEVLIERFIECIIGAAVLETTMAMNAALHALAANASGPNA